MDTLTPEAPSSARATAMPIALGPGSAPLTDRSAYTPLTKSKWVIRGAVQTLIARSGLSTSEVARRLGVDRSYVYRYINGQHCALPFLLHLATVCGGRILVEYPPEPIE